MAYKELNKSTELQKPKSSCRNGKTEQILAYSWYYLIISVISNYFSHVYNICQENIAKKRSFACLLLQVTAWNLNKLDMCKFLHVHIL